MHYFIMQLSWDHCRSFLAVLGEGSLSAAARTLRLTQPTLGRHVAELEETLGVALFTRSPSGLQPTEAALELRPHAEAMAAAAETLLRTASGEAADDRGTVRVTASEIIGTEVLPPILARFSRRHPRIAIELVVSNHTDNLLRRESDIAVRMVTPKQDALLQKRIGTLAIGLHARRDYLEAHGTPQSPTDLMDHVLIGFDTETPTVQAVQRLGLLPERSAFRFRTDSDIAQLQMIRAGAGIGGCQVMLAKRDPELVRVLPEAFDFGLECWLAMHEDLKSVRRMRLVYDELADGLAAYVRGQDD
ncbi:LysR family transcriptional regulator [Mesorhizobium sp. BR1-1-16]|uniref:LysR family transcriptional regulator n=1 Tax=Mesorhizobium sp. BR1-1-16 TaxID=2876653 RepID=UPI001CCFAE0F|nr:LysR family transcriptional regulator [Mesorhizobium sp. BR1-1-16]MBZ9936592.1 LysR family transcriptional regulator [Mesorhizobium sp. BR1-1-16]